MDNVDTVVKTKNPWTKQFQLGSPGILDLAPKVKLTDGNRTVKKGGKSPSLFSQTN